MREADYYYLQELSVILSHHGNLTTFMNIIRLIHLDY